jgi:hypothetical protein
MEDDIHWKLTSNGEYSTASAYNLQFFGLIESSFYKMVWKAWATPKAKHHAWLALQNRLWTRIDFEGEVGIIVSFARFASKPMKLTTIFSCIVFSPFGCGSYSRIVLAYNGYNRGNGKASIFKNGGHQWRRARAFTERA